MPPRWLSAAILVAWFASAAWLFRVEIWPSLEPNAPPPFTIDLFEEAQSGSRPIYWRVQQNGEAVLTAKTYVVHRSRENDFTMHANYQPRGKSRLDGIPARLTSMDSSYRVTPDGHLLGLDVKLEIEVSPLVKAEAHLWGDVQEKQFAPQYELNVPVLGKRSGALKPVAVSSYGSVVMPLHPVNRIADLRPGQAWRVPLFDPLADSMTSLTGSEARVRFLRAKVRPTTEVLPKNEVPTSCSWNEVPTPCFVIEYHEEGSYTGDKIYAETWVREADGLVLRQVVESSGEKWQMDRETP